MLNKQETIRELKICSKELGYSIKRRDCSKSLYFSCVNNFGSFNKAKENAGLEIKNKRLKRIDKSIFNKDAKLSQIASYITFDGHLYKDSKAFYYSSKNISDLNEFEKLIKNKLKISGKYYLNNGGATNVKTHKYIVFSKLISEGLIDLGIPKGDKTNRDFEVPPWVKKSRSLSKEYLKIAFFCEGSFKDDSRKNPRISIGISKTEEHLNSGINFMNSLKEMLEKFNIQTTKCYITGNRIRKKDGLTSRDIRFRILTQDNHKFINKIGWIK